MSFDEKVYVRPSRDRMTLSMKEFGWAMSEVRDGESVLLTPVDGGTMVTIGRLQEATVEHYYDHADYCDCRGVTGRTTEVDVKMFMRVGRVAA